MSLSGYEAGRIEFTALIDNWRKWLDQSLAFERSLAALEQAFADLEQLVGVRIGRARRSPPSRPEDGGREAMRGRGRIVLPLACSPPLARPAFTTSSGGCRRRRPAPAASVWYTCGMHPEVVQDHPGECPKCGMRLRPVSADRAAALGLGSGAPAPSPTPRASDRVLYWKSTMLPGEVHEGPGKDSMGMDLVPVYEDEVAAGGTIRIDPVIEQDMGIRVDTVTRGPLRHTVRTVGYVDYDETSLAAVTTKVDGWVEKLYVDRTGAQVHGGDAAVRALCARALLRPGGVPGGTAQPPADATCPRCRAPALDSRALIEAARTRLEYFDVSPEQIAELERRVKAAQDPRPSARPSPAS